MNWIYNGLPETHREVMIAFRAPSLLKHNNVKYTIASLDIRKSGFVIPDSYELIAWADFPRCNKDEQGQALTHHWLNVEGLK